MRASDLALLVTNQPNPIFLRNWREALELPAERHRPLWKPVRGRHSHLEDALANGKLERGDLLALGGFRTRVTTPPLRPCAGAAEDFVDRP